MDSIFSFNAAALERPFVIATIVCVALLAFTALRRPHLARIGLRNVHRRRTRTALIVFGLMLSTMFVASSLAIDDTLSLAVKTVAVFNLGRVDEDVTGGGGPLNLYPDDYGSDVSQVLAHDRHVAGVAPALVVPDLLVADATARQVRGGVSGFALQGSSMGPLGDLRTTDGIPVNTGVLAPTDVYLNGSTAQLLNAKPGDRVYLYSSFWPGHRYQFTIKGIASGGPLGDPPSVVLPMAQLQTMAGAQGRINHVYVANAGNGLTGVSYSDEIAQRTGVALPSYLRVDTVKQDGVTLALRAQDIFGRILTLYTLFALSIGLLLIFLIFVLLAAERRSELGMARAIGMRRSQIVQMLLFEGAAYDATAAAVGILVGLGLGILVVSLVSPTITRIGFPLHFSIQPTSMIVAFCLGLLFTLATIWLAAWTVSRITVAAALRDLPEPPAPQPALLAMLRDIGTSMRWLSRDPGKALAACGALVWGVITRGFVPLALGWWLMRQALDQGDAFLFSLALSLLVIGGVLILRWLALAAVAWLARYRVPPRLAARGDQGVMQRRSHDPLRTIAQATLIADRVSTLLIGGCLALYWSLPFDALENLGLARFSGGVQTFFVAGVMMVFGTVWALAPNLDLLLAPLGWLLAALGRIRHITRIALVYPAHQRFRTGIGLAMFSLVCFTMVVMACIAASVSTTYDNVPAQASDYDVAGQPLFTPVGGVNQLMHSLDKSAPSSSSDLAAVSAATPLPMGIIQPEAQEGAGWRVYPVSQVQGAFLDGVGLPLLARASGYSSDATVWQAVRTHPGDVVIDAGALSQSDANALGVQLPPPFSAQQFIGPPIASGLPGLNSLEGIDSSSDPIAQSQQQGLLAGFGAVVSNPDVLRHFKLRLRGVATGQHSIAPTTLWAADLRGGSAIKLTVVGIVNNVNGERAGLFGSPATFAPAERGLPPFGNEYYYFKVKSGVDAHATALNLGSALLDHGFETTVLQDVLLNVNGPRVFISRVIIGLVGLTLLIGMAALAVTGSRAVVERRQQIGMLRALGFHRWHVQLIFLIESLLIGTAGTAVGLFLGLILCRNVFAVDFFEPIQSGLALVVPWGELGVLCGAAVAASLVASLLPAIQAGLVTPADALRYE